MSQYADFANTSRATPQTERADARQVKNNAGGYVFKVDDLARARRFLILGTDGPTFYQTARALTIENAEVIVQLAGHPEHGLELVRMILDVSTRGLAMRRQPAIFALALAAAKGHPDVRALALSDGIFRSVIRTGTDLFQFVGYSLGMRGVSRAWRRAVGGFYTTTRDPGEAAYQMVKYRSRENRTHRDIVRLAHPKATNPQARALMQYAAKGVLTEQVPPLVRAFEAAKSATPERLIELISMYDLSWEMLPDWALSNGRVWAALIDQNRLPLGALLRQLPRLTNLHVIANPLDTVDSRVERTDQIVQLLTDRVMVKRARIHPMQALVALRTYAKGGGRTKVQPVQRIVDALNDLFYLSFENVEGAGKKTLLAVDVSLSMTWPDSTPVEGLSARDVAAAFAMVLQKGEPQSAIMGFSSQFVQLPIHPSMRLDGVLNTMANLPHGSTDISLPIRRALQQNWVVETFVIITDNETHNGVQHVFQALEEYRRKTGIPAKLVVLSTTATPFTVANPSDPGMLDIVGFSPDVTKLVAEFSRGW